MGKEVRRWMVRLILLGLAGAGVILVKPDLISDATKRTQVEEVREQLLKANTQGQERALQILGDTAKETQAIVGRVSRVTEEVTHQNPQEIINQAVANITAEVKDLPKEQVKKIKLEFCRDVMEEVSRP
ncbi:MAG: hypothetical protein HY381_00560 [Candidatus Chisholmbacteria bacterium]|nr:hypothetical protein [Candidatus Chisholmbacteria bacterium]